jgi:1,4-alpha-glucan branching enzyme
MKTAKKTSAKKSSATKTTSAKKSTIKAKGTTKKKSAQGYATEQGAGIKKQYLKSGNVCKVTFRLSGLAARDANNASIVGDFNNWSIYAHPMRKLKSGDFTATLELETGNEYQFRYLIDESRWENDWNADKYVKSPFGDSDNSVVIV